MYYNVQLEQWKSTEIKHSTNDEEAPLQRQRSSSADVSYVQMCLVNIWANHKRDASEGSTNQVNGLFKAMFKGLHIGCHSN